MPDEYIKRADAIATYEKASISTERLKAIPAADVRPVVHAEWDADGKCTACGKRWDEYMHDNGDDWGYFDPMPPFCLNRGAQMDADMREMVGNG